MTDKQIPSWREIKKQDVGRGWIAAQPDHTDEDDFRQMEDLNSQARAARESLDTEDSLYSNAARSMLEGWEPKRPIDGLDYHPLTVVDLVDGYRNLPKRAPAWAVPFVTSFATVPGANPKKIIGGARLGDKTNGSYSPGAHKLRLASPSAKVAIHEMNHSMDYFGGHTVPTSRFKQYQGGHKPTHQGDFISGIPYSTDHMESYLSDRWRLPDENDEYPMGLMDYLKQDVHDLVGKVKDKQGDQDWMMLGTPEANGRLVGKVYEDKLRALIEKVRERRLATEDPSHSSTDQNPRIWTDEYRPTVEREWEGYIPEDMEKATDILAGWASLLQFPQYPQWQDMWSDYGHGKEFEHPKFGRHAYFDLSDMHYGDYNLGKHNWINGTYAPEGMSPNEYRQFEDTHLGTESLVRLLEPYFQDNSQGAEFGANPVDFPRSYKYLQDLLTDYNENLPKVEGYDPEGKITFVRKSVPAPRNLTALQKAICVAIHRSPYGPYITMPDEYIPTWRDLEGTR